MRAAMAQAVVGDEQSDDDPSTLQLCEKVADLLGKEAGVFMPSGTMCNLVAILTHTRPGDELICDHQSHIYGTEAAGASNSHFKYLGAETDGVTIDFNNIADALVNFA